MGCPFTCRVLIRAFAAFQRDLISRSLPAGTRHSCQNGRDEGVSSILKPPASLRCCRASSSMMSSQPSARSMSTPRTRSTSTKMGMSGKRCLNIKGSSPTSWLLDPRATQRGPLVCRPYPRLSRPILNRDPKASVRAIVCGDLPVPPSSRLPMMTTGISGRYERMTPVS